MFLFNELFFNIIFVVFNIIGKMHNKQTIFSCLTMTKSNTENLHLLDYIFVELILLIRNQIVFILKCEIYFLN